MLLLFANQTNTPQFVEWTTNFSNTPPSVTLTYNKPVQIGTLLIAVVRWNFAGLVTPPSGWQLLDSITTQIVNFYVFYTIATAPTNVFTFTGNSSSGYIAASGIQVTNINQTNPFNSHLLIPNVPSTTYNSPSLTPSKSGYLPVAFIDTGDTTTPLTGVSPSSWANQTPVGSGSPYFFIGSLSIDATTVQSVTATFASALGYNAASWTAIIEPPAPFAILGASFTDVLTIAENITRTSISNRTLADALVPITEVIARASLANRSLADALVPITDAVSRSSVLGRGVGDTITVLESLARATSLARGVSDAIAMLDLVGRTVLNTRGLPDAMALTDQISTNVLRLIALADALTMADSVTAIKLGRLIAVALADTMTMTDSLSRITVTLRMPLDSIAILDSAYRSTFASRAVLDSMTVSETLARNQILARALTDAIAISDNFTNGARLINVSFNDFMTIYDAFAFSKLTTSYALVNMVVGVNDMPKNVQVKMTVEVDVNDMPQMTVKVVPPT